jgi:hypothetical protein
MRRFEESEDETIPTLTWVYKPTPNPWVWVRVRAKINYMFIIFAPPMNFYNGKLLNSRLDLFYQT